MNNIKHIFFDLDRTLWDFEENSHQELVLLYEKHKLQSLGIPTSDKFITKYKQINEECWALYRVNEISKEDLRSKRFNDTLLFFGIEDFPLSVSLGEDYIKESPYRTILFPNTIEILDYLSQNYQLHMITNGFEEVQHIKLKASNLEKYFKLVITSEQVGVKKPNVEIFDYALAQAGANAEESVYIGDDFEVDVLGAINAKWSAVYFNPEMDANNHPDAPNIKNLIELKELF